MNKVFTFLSALLVTGLMSAQAPLRISYQAVIRNVSGQLVTNTLVGMQISILQGTSEGTAVYVETHTPTTNANGLISVEIGGGTLVSGDFESIDWADGPYFIKTEIDTEGGESYEIIGISRFLSVPYAFYSKTAETLAGRINEADPLFSAWDKSSGISITESQITDLGNYISEETDPLFSLSVASGITATDTASWNNKIDSYTETDPVFTSWDKSSGISITESQISDLGNYISEETDPLFSLSVASGITATDTAYWNNKIDSFTETDPVFTSWDKSSGISITESQISDLGSYIEIETDPGLSANFDLTNAAKGDILRYDGDKFVISSNTEVLSTEEIAGLTPETGYSVFNRTENIYQIYTGTGWVAIPVNCWPEPSLADAGEDQYIEDIKTTVLAANSPKTGHGTGQWSMESGTGGSFENMYDPHTTFTWEEFGNYTLRWTITTVCGSSYDEMIITSRPEPYSHTITIDGVNDFTVADEMFQTSSMGYNGYITWDTDYLYLGYKGPDIASSNTNYFLNIYLGGTPGTMTGRMMNTQQPMLNFSAGHNIIWNTSNTLLQSYSYDGSSWITSSLVTPSDISRSSDFVEMRIPLASLGSPEKLKVHMNMLNATPGGEWSWGAVPSTSFSDRYDPDYTKYFEFNLKDKVKPNQYMPLP